MPPASDPRSDEAVCAEVERLDGEATAGPWRHDNGCCGNGLGHHHIHAPNGKRLAGQMPEMRIGDAALIAAYRTAAPELARRLRAATARVERMREALDIIAQWGDGPKVTGAFDCPAHAMLARKALASLPSDSGREE